MMPITLHPATDVQVPSHNAGRASRIAAVIAAGWREWRLRRRLKATVYTLHGLDDRTLADIGIDRSEIELVVEMRGCERRRGVTRV